MKVEVSEEIKKEIFRLISQPGLQIEDIAEQVNLDYEIVMEVLSEEYLRKNLDYGRRLCCRF
jgi:predicted transcriptional regulator